MPAKNPRINVSLETSIYNVIQNLANEGKTSMSNVVRDLVRESLALREDVGLAEFAEEREKTFDDSKALEHEEVWS